MSYGDITKQLTAIQRENGGKLRPTQVWVSSLCSYWYESVAEVCRIIRKTLPDAKIVLLGQYARLMPKHAAEACAADYVVSRPPDLRNELAAFDLYGDKRPPFVALQLNPKTRSKTSLRLSRGTYCISRSSRRTSAATTASR